MGRLDVEWISVEDRLPEPETLVWIKRKKGSIYLGCRNNKPITNNPDFSRDCHWNGNGIYEIDENVSCWNGLKFRSNFQDGTVESWMPLPPPPEKS